MSGRSVPARLVAVVLLAVSALGLAAVTAEASHLRYRGLSWARTSPGPSGPVRFDVTHGYACSTGVSCSSTSFSSDALNFGDGFSGGSTFTRTAFNTAEDWIIGTRQDTHTYPSTTASYTAVTSSCCTISSLRNGNDSTIQARALVTPQDNESPVTSIPTIVDVGNVGVQQWSIPAIDAGGQKIRWRLATSTEACGCAQPQPPGLAMDALGKVTWDTTGRTTGLYYSSVIIEALNASDTVISSTQASYLIRVSVRSANAAPTWTASTPADGTQYNVVAGTPVSIAVGARDTDTGDTVKIDKLGVPTGATLTAVNGNPASATFSWTPALNQVGAHLVTLTAQDSKNPPAQAPSRTYTIVVAAANTPPTAPGEPTGSPALGNLGNVLVSWAASTDTPLDPIKYKLEGADADGAGTWQTLATGLTTNSATVNLAEGTWRFRVTATDSQNAAGGPTTTAAANRVVVDKTRPATPALAVAPGETAFAVAGTDWYRDSVQLALSDNGDPALADGTAGSGLVAYGASVLASSDGQQTVSRTVSDKAGNTSLAATRTVSVDKTAPALSVSHTASLQGWNTAPSVNLVLSATDTGGSGIAGAPACTDNGSPLAGTTVTGEGVHAISCSVADAVGHTATATDVVRIDSVGPQLTLPADIAAVASGSHSAIVTYTVAANDLQTGPAPVSCTPQSGSSFPLHVTTVSCEAFDARGNRSAGTFKVDVSDASAPSVDPHVTGAFVGEWAVGDVGLSWVVADAESDISGTSGCDPELIVVDTNGTGFTCSATSEGGTTSRSLTIRRDTTAPSVGINYAPNGSGGWSRSTPVAFSAVASDAGSGLASGPDCTDSATNGPVPSSGWSPADGTYQVVCAAKDLVGWSSSTVPVEVKVDTTAPTISVTHAVDGDGGWNVADDVALAVTVTDAGSGAGEATCTEDGTPLAGNVVSGEGIHEVTCSVSDLAGNENEATDTVKIDTVDPDVSAAHDVDGDEGWNRSGPVAVTATADDAGSGLSGPATCAQSSVIGDGSHDVECSARDAAGNTGKATETVKIDSAAPVTTAAAPATPQKQATTVSVSATDATSGVKASYVRLDGGDWTAADSITVPASDGPHTVSYYSVDRAGHEEAVQAVNVLIDTVAPTSEDDAPAGWSNEPVEVELEAADPEPGSGVAYILAKVDDGEYAKGDDVEIPAPADHSNDGVHTISYRAVDNAGNEEAVRTATVRIDTTDPSSSDDASDDWSNEAVTVQLSAADGDGSGVDAIFAKLDDGSFAKAGSVSVPAPADGSRDGTHTITYYAVDAAGNEESHRSAEVRIDTTAPVTTDDAPTGWQDASVPVHLSASDGQGSGIASTSHALDGAADKTGTDVTVSGGGVHELVYRSVDVAGNVERDRVATVRIDLDNPSITGGQTPAANGFGWVNRSAVVEFDCADADSGIAGCEDDIPLGDETTKDGTTVHGTAMDKVGHTASASVGPVRIDKTAPSLSGAAATEPNGLGWYRGDVTIEWTSADGLSGIDPSTDPADSVMGGEGAALKAGPVSVQDKAGNGTTASGPAVNIDRTDPSIKGTTIPAAPNAAGWFNQAVTVKFDCADVLSGMQSCSADDVLARDGTGQSSTGTAVDKAGNSVSATVGGIRIDTLAPQTTAVPACATSHGYCSATSTTVDLKALDPVPSDGVVTSGVRQVRYRIGSAGEWTTVAGDHAVVDVPLPGSGTVEIHYLAVDEAGNQETATTARIDHDSVAPTVTHAVAPPANGYGWNRTDATVHFDASDDLSGVDLASITPDVLVAQETDGRTVDGQATDLAGNVGRDSVVVKLDKRDPTIVASAPAAGGANGWHTAAVKVQFACDDPGTLASKVATCDSSVTLDHGQTATGSVEDRAGNRGSVGVGPYKVDGAAPSVTVNGVANGGVYLLGAVPAASCAAEDNGPAGVDGACATTVTGGLANGVGTYAFTATAKDRAGNATTVKGSYQVRYAVRSGTSFWLQPINDTAHTSGLTTSVFKAGSTVPAKFRLVDAGGRVVQATTAPQWIAPVKGGSTALQVDESVYSESASTGDVFKWSAADQQYQYNWSSPKAGGGFYHRIGVKLDDGTTQTVNIGLK